MSDKSYSLNYNEVIELKNHPMTEEEVGFYPDRRDGNVYLYKPELKLAAEVALVTGRPLLLRGEPGSGKSSFASFVARNLNWRYYEFTVTARTQARDLLWNFDTLRRLNDAQRDRKSELNDYDYVKPGVLWWVFNRELAFVRGDSKLNPKSEIELVLAEEPFYELNKTRSGNCAVLLIDEIDKADPDVPNNLLVPLGSQSFTVEETGTVIERTSSSSEGKLISPLVIITTNEERALPQAFLRRCVVHVLEHPKKSELIDIAISHFLPSNTKPGKKDRELFEKIANKIVDLRKEINDPGVKKPSTAEYLDAVRACKELKIEIESEAWNILENVVMSKGRV
jgi:MoxR-like ATPase